MNSYEILAEIEESNRRSKAAYEKNEADNLEEVINLRDSLKVAQDNYRKYRNEAKRIETKLNQILFKK